MKAWRWKNPYIELASSKPKFLIDADHETFPEALGGLRQRISGISKAFLELGAGSGGHLLEQAGRDPASLFVGIELRFKRAFRSAEKAEINGLDNVVFIRGSALPILEGLADASLSGIYVNFPDPWDKRRWRKNRMLDEKTLVTFARLLKPEGFFSFKTDHHSYFLEVQSQLTNQSQLQVTCQIEDLHASAPFPSNVESEFEKLFKSKGFPVFYLLSRKISPG